VLRWPSGAPLSARSTTGFLLESHVPGCRAPGTFCRSPQGGKGRLGNVRGEAAISNKVFVGNLSFDVTRDELIQAFSAAGKVVDAKVPTDRETGRPRGFAFVEFESDEAAEKSITLMNGKDLKGRPLRVNEAENRPPRAPGMGGPSFRPGGYRPPGAAGYSAPSFNEFTPMDDRGRPFKNKGSRRNIRRRKRGFD
jgi:cold-inducible RNA-binding protein